MLNSDNSVLIIIDMQEKLIKSVNNHEHITSEFAKVIHSADILNIPTIMTEQYPKGLGRTIKEIKNTVFEGTYKVEKTSFSAMAHDDFRKALHNLGRKQIVIGGIETHICILQTAFDLINEGYEVFILKDCTSSRKEADKDTALELLRQYNAKITSAEIVIFEWLKTSEHPEFKLVQSLVK